MMYFRPIKPTEVALKRMDLWGFLGSGALEAVTHFGGNELWLCGNIHCMRGMIFKATDAPPSTCRYCNGGINWIGIKQKVIMQCPLCPYYDENIYETGVCPKHPPDQTAKLQPTIVTI
jgi:hypothetical protein